MPKIESDLNFDNTAKGINSPEPTDNGDLVPKSFVLSFDVVQTAETSTTSTTTDSTKASLVTPALPLGNYLLEWTFKWRAAAANRAMRVNVKDNGTELLNHIEFVPSTVPAPMITGRKKLVGISGIKTFTLNFRVQGTATTVFMADAILSVRRVP